MSETSQERIAYASYINKALTHSPSSGQFPLDPLGTDLLEKVQDGTLLLAFYRTIPGLGDRIKASDINQIKTELDKTLGGPRGAGMKTRKVVVEKELNIYEKTENHLLLFSALGSSSLINTHASSLINSHENENIVLGLIRRLVLLHLSNTVISQASEATSGVSANPTEVPEISLLEIVNRYVKTPITSFDELKNCQAYCELLEIIYQRELSPIWKDMQESEKIQVVIAECEQLGIGVYGGIGHVNGGGKESHMLILSGLLGKVLEEKRPGNPHSVLKNRTLIGYAFKLVCLMVTMGLYILWFTGFLLGMGLIRSDRGAIQPPLSYSNHVSPSRADLLLTDFNSGLFINRDASLMVYSGKRSTDTAVWQYDIQLKSPGKLDVYRKAHILQPAFEEPDPNGSESYNQDMLCMYSKGWACFCHGKEHKEVAAWSKSLVIRHKGTVCLYDGNPQAYFGITGYQKEARVDAKYDIQVPAWLLVFFDVFLISMGIVISRKVLLWTGKVLIHNCSYCS